MSSSAIALKPGLVTLSVKFNGTEIAYQFQKTMISVGRAEDCDLSLSKDNRVSRNHAEIKWNGPDLVLNNVSQKNLLLLNGQPVQTAALKNQDLIKVGDTEIKILIPEAFQTSTKNSVINSSSTLPASASTWVTQPAQPKPQPTISSMSPPFKNEQKVFKKAMPSFKKETNPIVIVLIIIVIGFVGFSLLKPNVKKDKLNLRSQEEIIKDLEKSEIAVKELEKKQEDSGKNTVQYKMAQEHYIKGFRDYRQGQYARAIQSFQASISFYPQHQLALKYLNLSKRKFDELIDFNLMQGHKYLNKNNYRLCKSSFASVMIMVKDPLDEKYKEGKQFYNECLAKLEDKY